MIERVHQVLNNCLRTYELEGTELNERDPWGPFLSAAAFAIQSTFHTTLGASPRQLVFRRDMLLPIEFKANWALIREWKQAETNRNNAKENKSRIPHQYKVGDKVLLRNATKTGILKSPRKGPFMIEHVHTNGTVQIR